MPFSDASKPAMVVYLHVRVHGAAASIRSWDLMFFLEVQRISERIKCSA